MSNTNKFTYSFRAEMPDDVEIFLGEISKIERGLTKTWAVIYVDLRIPERHVELNTDLDLETLRNILRQIPDSHLMLETLRPGTMKDGELPRYYHD